MAAYKRRALKVPELSSSLSVNNERLTLILLLSLWPFLATLNETFYFHSCLLWPREDPSLQRRNDCWDDRLGGEEGWWHPEMERLREKTHLHLSTRLCHRESFPSQRAARPNTRDARVVRDRVRRGCCMDPETAPWRHRHASVHPWVPR